MGGDATRAEGSARMGGRAHTPQAVCRSSGDLRPRTARSLAAGEGAERATLGGRSNRNPTLLRGVVVLCTFCVPTGYGVQSDQS